MSLGDLLEISLGLVVGPAVGMLGTRRGNIAWGGAVLSGRPAGEIIPRVALGLTVLGFSLLELLEISLGLVVGPALGKPRDQKREHQLGLG